MTPQRIQMLLDGMQAAAVSIGVLFATIQLRDLQRKRTAESLDRMFAEWRAGLTAYGEVSRSMPLHTGSVPERAAALALELRRANAIVQRASNGPVGGLQETMELARRTVHALNDLGAFVEVGGVEQVDFFSHFHQRIAELAYLLEPYALLVSHAREVRWGFRLRRLRVGAERFHRASQIHSHLDLVARGVVIVGGRDSPRNTRFGERFECRRRLVPRKHDTYEEEDELMAEVERHLRLCEPPFSRDELRTLLSL